MITKQPDTRHGLPLTINFEIPAYWTPEQALAVFELLDDLREKIGAHYSEQLFEISRQQHLHAPTDDADDADDTEGDDQPF
jgi:hypothetical protein